MNPYSSKRDAYINLYLTKCSKMPDEDNEEDDDIDESDDEAVVDEGASELANSNISVACMALI